MIDGVGRGQVPRMVVTGGDVTAPRNTAVLEPASKAAGGTQARLGGVVRAMAASAPVDSAKVETLRLAIASGHYTADPEAIAARMMAFGRK